MEKKLLGTTQTPDSVNRKQFKEKYAIFVACIVVISVGLAGYFWGRVSERCDRQVGVVTVAGAQVGEVREKIPPWFDVANHLTVNMAIGSPSQPLGTCLCTVEAGVALLKDAYASSETLAMVDKGQCFRYLETFRWLTENHVFYRVLNTNDNQVGWISSRFLQTPDNCTAPPIPKQMDNLDLELGFAGGDVSQQCLQCICDLESGCRPIGCHPDVGSLSCGYFQIKNSYWTDCGKPGDSLLACGNNQYCSSMCVQRYMARYVPGSGCAKTCETYAREHNGGPRGCKSGNTIGYWNRLIKLPGCQHPAKVYETFDMY